MLSLLLSPLPAVWLGLAPELVGMGSCEDRFRGSYSDGTERMMLSRSGYYQL